MSRYDAADRFTCPDTGVLINTAGVSNSEPLENLLNEITAIVGPSIAK